MNNPARLLAILLLGTAPLAAAGVTTEHTVTTIEIDLADGSEPLVVELDSRQTGFRLEDLADGESRNVDDGSGRRIVVTRRGDGFLLNVDGREFDLPAAPAAAAPPAPPPPPEADGTAIQETLVLKRAPGDGLVVLGADHLSDTERETLRRAMIETGLADEVTILGDGRQTGDRLPRWIERHTVVRDGEVAP